MKKQLDLYARLTYGYRTGWQELDNWEHVGPVLQTKPVLTHEDDDGDYYTQCLVILPKDTLDAAKRIYRHVKPELNPEQRFAGWLANQVSSLFNSGCQCEHDCCGHMQFYGNASPTTGKGNREFSVRIRGRRNV